MRAIVVCMLFAGMLASFVVALPYKEVGRYELNATPMSWTDAHQACKDKKGFLAIPQSPSEAAELVQVMTAGGATEAHVGFHDMIREGKYITVLDQSLDNQGYFQWADDNAPGDDADCGSLANGGIKSIPCDTQLPSLCQLPLWSGYEFIQGHGYYRLATHPLTWLEAFKQCRTEGAYLLVMRNTPEVEELQKKYLDIFKEDYELHYGAHHFYADHTFVTIFDEKLTDSGYYTWHSGFPGVGGISIWSNENVPVVTLHIATDWANKGIQLRNTSIELPYLCKHDLSFRGSSFVFPEIPS